MFTTKTYLSIFSIVLCCFAINPVVSVEEGQQKTLKSGIEYKLEYDQEIPLRVTQIPTEYGMLKKI